MYWANAPRVDEGGQFERRRGWLMGRTAPVAIEATFGWSWAVDALQAGGFEVHLEHPAGMKAMRGRKRVKTDARHSFELANLLGAQRNPSGPLRARRIAETGALGGSRLGSGAGVVAGLREEVSVDGVAAARPLVLSQNVLPYLPC